MSSKNGARMMGEKWGKMAKLIWQCKYLMASYTNKRGDGIESGR